MDSCPACRWITLACLLLALPLNLTACQPLPEVWLDPLPSLTTAPPRSGEGIIQVYFTAPAGDRYQGGPDQPLVEAIDQARSQVDAALYDLDLWSIRNALIRAQDRGVLVRLVVEGDSWERPEIQDLVRAGIPVIADQSESLMHHKFLVIDQAEVWTGSMNLTVNGAYRHLNNLLRVRSTRLAENYTVEFEEMFLEGFFGENSLRNTPHPVLDLNGLQVETYFSPDDSTAKRLIDLILAAEQSIDFLVYSFTSDGIGDALIYQAGQGILVRGVFDAAQSQSGVGGEFERLREAGLDVLLDGHPEKLHHKVIIIDGEILVTGSYNFTRSAERFNDENTLVIHDPELGEIFLAEFEWIYQDGVSR